MKISITTDTQIIAAYELRKHLELLPEGIEFQVYESDHTFREIEPTILVAIVGAISTCLGALISGLLQAIQHTNTKKIILQTEKGSRIEVPVKTSSEEIDKLIEKLKKLDNSKV